MYGGSTLHTRQTKIENALHMALTQSLGWLAAARYCWLTKEALGSSCSLIQGRWMTSTFSLRSPFSFPCVLLASTFQCFDILTGFTASSKNGFIILRTAPS